MLAAVLETAGGLQPTLEYLNLSTWVPKTFSREASGWELPLSPRNISGQMIQRAGDLVPREIRQRRISRTISNGLLFIVPESLDEIDVGDLFVTYDPYTPGHVGCIVGKKEEAGKTILLLSDANRKSDGKVRIFEVDETNFDAVFGTYPQHKVIIKKR